MILSEIQKGYVAGIIDGQGSICLTRQHKNEHRTPVITVASTTYEILQYLKENIGGSISKKKTYKDNHKPSWQWSVKTNLAIELLNEVKEYLLVPQKKYRANLIVDEYKLVTSRNGRYSKEKLEAKLDFEKRFFEFNES